MDPGGYAAAKGVNVDALRLTAIDFLAMQPGRGPGFQALVRGTGVSPPVRGPGPPPES